MADRIPLIIEGSSIREIPSDDRLDVQGALEVNGHITPGADSSYDIGTSSLKFRDIHLSSGTIHLGGVKLRADGNKLTIQDSANAASGINAASLGTISSDEIAEGSTNLFTTAARTRSHLQVTDAGGDGSFAFDSASGKFTYTGPSASEVRAHVSATDAGGDGSFAYNSSTGAFTYTGPSASDVRAHITANKGVSITSGEINVDSANIRAIFSAVDSGGDGAFTYEEGTGKFRYRGPSAAEVRAHINVVDAGGDGSFAYDSARGKLTYTGPSASDVRAHFSAGEGIDISSGAISAEDATTSNKGIASFSSDHFGVSSGAVTIKADGIDDTHIDFGTGTNQVSTADVPEQTNLYFTTARGISAARDAINVVDAGGDGSFAYDSSKGKLTYTGPSAANARAHFSATDAGGDGSFAYNSGTGAFTYTGPSASEVRAHISGGTGVGVSSGEISIGQAVATTDSVTFNGLYASGNVIVGGNFTVNGTTTTVNSTVQTIADPLIELNTGAGSNANDLGFVFERGSTGNNAAIIWDESEDKFKMGTTTATGSSTGNMTVATGTLIAALEGNASTATALATARNIGGVSFDGTGNINLPGVNTGGNQNTSGTAAIATTVTVSDNENTDESNVILFAAGAAGSGNLGVEADGNMTYNPSTGKITATGFVGALTGDVTGDISGTAGVATAVTISDNENTNENNVIIFGAGAAGSGNIGLEADGNMTYNPSTGKITATGFVGALTGDASGNAATATALANARTIGGVSFDGTGNINLPGVNTGGNQNTSGTAAIATTVTITDNENTDEDNAIVFTAGGDVDGGNLGLEADGTLTYNPSTGKITATGFIGALTGDASGNAGTATALATARNIGGVSFDGTGNINLPGVNTGGNQNTSGTAAIATTVTVSDNENTNENNVILFAAGAAGSGNLGVEADGNMTYNPSTGKITATGFVGALTGNASGSAATLATARAIAIAGDAVGTANFDGSAGISISIALADNCVTSAELASASTLLIKNAAGSTLKTIIGAGS